MSDLIRREDVLDILDEEEWRVLAIAAVLALPAVQPVTVDQLAQIIRTVDGNHSLGAGALAERILSAVALPAVQPDAAAVWNAAIREAAGAAWAVEGGDRWMRAAAQDAILDLIDKPAHVNETPKSEHDAANVLTPATKGGE